MAADFALKVVLSAVDGVTAPMRKINAQLAKINAPFVKLNNSIRALGQEAGIGRLSKSIGNVGDKLGRVGREFGALATKATIGATAIGGALFGLVKSTADYGDEAAKSAQRAGISIKAWQEYTYAAGLADVTNEGLLNGFRKLNQNMIEAATGAKTYQKWFERAGIPVKELKNLKPEEVFERIAEKFASMEDGAKKTALAMALFGKSGADLIPLLNGGSKGLDQARKEAEKFGLVISDDAAHASEDFNDNLSRLFVIISSVGRIIGGTLLPIFNDAVLAISNWVLANRDLIRLRVTEWVEKLKRAWPGLRDAIVEVWDKLLSFGKWLGGDTFGFKNWKVAIGLAALAITGPLIGAVAALGTALIGLNATIAGTPVGLLIIGGAAAIGGLAWGISKLNKLYTPQAGRGHGAHGESIDFASGSDVQDASVPTRLGALGALTAPPGVPGAPGASGSVDVNVKVDAPAGTRVGVAGRGNIRTSLARTGRLMPDIGGGL